MCEILVLFSFYWNVEGQIQNKDKGFIKVKISEFMKQKFIWGLTGKPFSWKSVTIIVLKPWSDWKGYWPIVSASWYIIPTH